MFSLEKSTQLIQKLSALEKHPDTHSTLHSDIHAWLIENLPFNDAREIRGTFGCNFSPNKIGHHLETFSFYRFANFVYGVLVFDQKLYEFLPGTIYVYDLPPSRLVAIPSIDLREMPSNVHVYYGAGNPNKTYRQYLIDDVVVWIDRSECGRGGWHRNLPQKESLPATNGGAIRAIFSQFGIHFNSLDPDQKWMGSHPEWKELVRIHGCSIKSVASEGRDHALLHQYRDGMLSYDPTAPALESFFKGVQWLKTQKSSPAELKAEFRDLAHRTFAALLTA